jgi:hypothetical protein
MSIKLILKTKQCRCRRVEWNIYQLSCRQLISTWGAVCGKVWRLGFLCILVLRTFRRIQVLAAFYHWYQCWESEDKYWFVLSLPKITIWFISNKAAKCDVLMQRKSCVNDQCSCKFCIGKRYNMKLQLSSSIWLSPSIQLPITSSAAIKNSCYCF